MASTVKRLLAPWMVLAAMISACGGGDGSSSGSASSANSVGASSSSSLSSSSVSSSSSSSASSASSSVSSTSSSGGGGSGGDEFGSGADPVADPTGNLTSYNLIDAAHSAGAITEEQALLYKLYVDFGDPALPAQYHGDDTGLVEGDAHQQVVAYIDRVGRANVVSATLNALLPFFVPAYYEGSWWHRQHPTANSAAAPAKLVAQALDPSCNPGEQRCKILSDWKNVAGVHVVVWYLAANESSDGPRASMLLQEFENTIWPKLTALMGRTPISDLDTGLTTETDGRLDVMLIDLPANKEGRTEPQTLFACKAVPAHIYLNRALPNQGLIANAAHEFMHAIQFSYNVAGGCLDDYHTIQEATAVWATNFIYPSNDWEHKYAQHYLTGGNTVRAYDDKTAPMTFRYGAYVFPLFLQTRFGATIVKEIWGQTLVFSEELLAINGALVIRGASFAQEWPKFVAANWNRDTIASNNYLTLDRMTDLPRLENDFNFTMPAGGVGNLRHAFSLPHAASAYYRIVFGDTASRSVMLFNGVTFLADTPDLTGAGNTVAFTALDVLARSGASMQIYLKVNGVWQSAPLNLSNVMALTVCRDDPAGNIDEIVFMYANAEINVGRPNYTALAPRSLAPGIVATNIGCRDWTGNLSMTRPLNPGQETLTISNVVLKNMVPTAAPPPGNDPTTYPLPVGGTTPVTLGFGHVYANASGTAVWTYDHPTSNCSNKGNSTFSIANPTVRHTFSNWTVGGAGEHGVSFSGFLDAVAATQLSYVSKCTSPASTKTVVVGTVMDARAFLIDQNVRISRSTGLSLSGTSAQTGDPLHISGTWSLTGLTH